MKKLFVFLSIVVVTSVFIGVSCSVTKKFSEINLDSTCDGKWQETFSSGEETEETLDSDIKDEMPDMYMIPNWYKKDIVIVGKEDKIYGEKTKQGEEFEVVARFMPWLTDMKNVKVELATRGGVKILEGEKLWEGEIKRCEVKEFRAKAVWNEETNDLKMVNYFITYDFPDKAILEYINQMKDEKYDVDFMREELIEAVHNIMVRDEFTGIDVVSNGMYIH